MADIFVSYARADKARVAPLVAALERQGWSVWWDPEIAPGQEFDQQILRELRAAKAAIVVWTPVSVTSRWVRGEAREAADRGILVPVRFDAAELPLDARSLHTTDLDDWREDHASRAFQALARALSALLGQARPLGGAATMAASDLSIAVLPFVNMSPDPDQEYFSDGLTEELLNQLAQLKELRVIGRTSCFAFKGKNEDLRAIGQKLGVAHILEGSVRKAGKRLRITAQLIKCNGHHHLWSQNYDRDLDDVFAIQDDVSRAVADALQITLGVGQKTQAPGGTRNAEAYDLYLRALALMQNGSYPTMLRVADMLRRSVALDPQFANAWLQLADAISIVLTFGRAATEPLREEQGRALDKVIAIAPDLWSGHAARAGQLISRQELLAADQAFTRAIELGPRPFPEVGPLTSFIGAAGRISESLPYFKAIRAADPLRPLPTYQPFLTLAGHMDEADAEYARTREMALGPLQLADWFAFAQTLAVKDRAGAKQHLQRLIPNSPNALIFNDELLAVFDDSQAAIAWIRRKLADPSQDLEGIIILFAFMAAYFGASDYALELLRHVFIELKLPAPAVNIWHPVFAAVRKLPAFKDFVREIGIYDYWRESGKWGDFARPLDNGDFEIIR